MTDRSHEIYEWIRSHYFGKYRGVVRDNQDSTSRGRLKVKVSAVLDTLEVWAMPCVPYAGDGVGFYSLPPVGSGVWIEFEAGDPSYPIWSGCFWADGETPGDADPDVKVWQTDAITVTLDDSAGEMTMENQLQSSITLSDSISIASGEATQTVGVDGIVSAQGAGKLEVTVTGVVVNDGAFEVV
jgi:Type VI secretion system/phage-baseplate injector OB domain